jgi:hypothetical protein
MFTRLTLISFVLILATPLLAQTKAVITGGPASTCAQPDVPQSGSAVLQLCSATDTTRLGGDDGDDDGSQGDED